jgi:hypothetical protein
MVKHHHRAVMKAGVFIAFVPVLSTHTAVLVGAQASTWITNKEGIRSNNKLLVTINKMS